MSILRQKLNELATLLEDRTEGIAKRFVPEIVKRFGDLYQANSGWVDSKLAKSAWFSKGDEGKATVAKLFVQEIIWADPHPQKQYATWMVQTFVRGQLLMEDLPRLRDAIALYHNCKAAGHIPRSHDLGRITVLNDFYNLVKPFKPTTGAKAGEIIDQRYAAKMEAESKVVLDTPEHEIRIPMTNEAAQWFGRHTEWCTAWGGKFGRHPTKTQQTYRGRLYIITHKPTGTQWQFHRESAQFKDDEDKDFPRDRMAQEHPEVYKFFIEEDMSGRVQVGTFEGTPVYDTGSALLCSRGVGLNVTNPLFNLSYRPSREPGSTTPATMWQAQLDYTRVHQRLETEPELLEPVVALLRNANIGGNEVSFLRAGYVFDKGNWTTVSQLPPLAAHGSYRIVGAHDIQRYLVVGPLHPSPLFEISLKEDDGGHYFDMADLDSDIERSSLKDLVLKFLRTMKLNDYIMSSEDYDDYDLLDDGSDTDLYDTKLVKEFGGFFPLHVDYRVNGVTPRFKIRLRDRFFDDMDKKWAETWDGDNVMLHQFSNLSEAMSELGDAGAEHVAKVLTGNQDGWYHDHYDTEAESDNIDDFIDNMTPQALKEVGAWLTKQYSGEFLEFKTDRGIKKLVEADDIKDFLSELGHECGELKSAADTAVSMGQQYGAEEEMSSQFKKAVEESGLWFQRDGEWSPGGYEWDKPCAVFVPIKTLMNLMDTDSSVSFDDIDWVDELSLKIKCEEPQYGWSGYDDDAAYEEFLSQLSEANILTSKTALEATKAHQNRVGRARRY